MWWESQWWESESALRLFFFFGVLIIMSCWELLFPRRPLTMPKGGRWGNNLLLVFINSLALRLLVPLGGVGVAQYAGRQQWGLFSLWGWNGWWVVLLSVVLLDILIYAQHWMFHKVPLFWRLHMVHHVDLDIDVTTGLRFHTLEILLSFGLKAAAILALGISAEAVIIFEILLNGTAMFNHSNVRLPLVCDKLLRLFLVTPDMHRVHHSVIPHETNSNYGFNLPWWDYLFRTYCSQPKEGHDGMTIGLAEYREKSVEHLPYMLMLPFTAPRVKRTNND